MYDTFSRYKLGRKCPFCDHSKLYKMNDGRLKCGHCKARFSLAKLRKDLSILYYFYLETSARKTANEMHMSYKPIYTRFMHFRKCISSYLEAQFAELNGELEIDESYFGGKRKGKRGRGAAGKVAVMGILERKGRIYTTVIPNAKAETLMQEIKSKTIKGSVFYTDTFKSYKSLTQVGKHLEINHQKDFAKGRTHINGIEGFWSYAKERLHKYHGVDQAHFPLYLKELEFRFNYRTENALRLLFEIVYQNANFGPKTT
ncbi:MAG: IS1595 family transposase [Candidatus Micrarchaeota archaeon]